MDLNEFQTRIQLIDKALKKSGWDVKNPTQVRSEIDTKQSNFSNFDYKEVAETLKNDLESKYADYLLLDKKGAPLAIIEAKRTSKDPYLTAKQQAEEYAEDIKKQTGKNVFIFLSNGETIYFYNYPYQNPRAVMGFHSREDLEKIQWINENKQPMQGIDVSESGIVDRHMSIEVSKRVLESINKNKRKALIVMATGTGKTRVAMAIIDVLKKYKWVRRVLFVADRKSLRDQAMNKGFKQFFPNESKDTVYSGSIDHTKNLFVTTIQTMMECYDQFSPGFFDLIISDEAHRSIYNKWKEVFTYFDAIQIGLTATPREAFKTDDMRDTFRFFDCDEDAPTAMYDYEDAVNDGVLVDFKKHIFGAQTNFQVKGLKSEDLTDSQKDELLGKGVDPENIDFEGTKFEKKFVTKGTNEAIMQEFFLNAQTDQSGTLPAKSIIFAMTKKHAHRLLESFEKLFPEHVGLAEVIVSDNSRAKELMEKFEKESYPRIAISVDMMDTGVDVPEVCNLVFAKPVFSKIKFWQMLGRGTRSNSACEHEEWLPEGEKTYFKVFDFWNNFDFFNMKPDGVKASTTEAITVKVFRTRVEQLRLLSKQDSTYRVEQAKDMILSDIKELPTDSMVLREKASDIEKAKSSDLYSRKGLDPYEFLNKKISPLMKYKSANYEELSFLHKCEKYKLALLNRNEKLKERYSKLISEVLEEIPTNINEVQQRIDSYNKFCSIDFWNDPSYEDINELIDTMLPLVKFRDKEKVEPIIVDLSDEVIQRKIIEFGPNKEQDYVKNYREKVENKIKDLIDSHPTIQKIKRKEPLSEEDINELEKTLDTPDIYLNKEVLGKFYAGTFVQFIKEVLGMYSKDYAKEKINDMFQQYIVENNKQYNANQLRFLGVLKTVLIEKGHIDTDMLYDPPFTNVGDPMDLFSESELQEWIDLCHKAEAQV